jgi:hypothetical protein
VRHQADADLKKPVDAGKGGTPLIQLMSAGIAHSPVCLLRSQPSGPEPTGRCFEKG